MTVKRIMVALFMLIMGTGFPILLYVLHGDWSTTSWLGWNFFWAILCSFILMNE